VLEIIGRGGFGTVYRARQLAVGREVALKVDQRMLASERDQRRFVREVTAAGHLSGHPNVVDVYDAGVLPDGRPYLVLELCPNGSLWDRVAAAGPLAPAEVRDIGVRIADALAAAHAAGVLHRDVKPQNVLVTRYGFVALADFGLAAMPRPGMELSATRESLTPAYAPPEAFRLVEPVPAGDVYSLGATLYALLAGRPPRFPADREPDLATIIALLREPIPDLVGVPGELTGALRHAMADDPAARPAAAAFREELAALALPGTGPPPAAPGHPGVVSWHTPDEAARVTGLWPPPGRTIGVEGPAQASGAAPPAAPSGLAPPAFGSGLAPSAARSGQAPAAFGSGLAPPAALPSGLGPPAVGSGQAAADGVVPVPGSRAQRLGRRSRRRRGPAVVVVTAACMLTVVVVVAVVLISGGPRPAGGGRSGGAPPATRPPAARSAVEALGIQTVAEGCPAAAVSASARCTRVAECWSAPVFIVGRINVDQRDCGEDHVWETFAVAPMPADVTKPDEKALSAHPQVRKLCATQVMLASRTAEARRSLPSDGWSATAFPPTVEDFAKGVRAFRCVGKPRVTEIAGAVFRPLQASP